MENLKPKKPQPKLKAFKAIQKNFAIAGISPKLVTQSYLLNWKILQCFLLLWSATAFMCVHTINYAETFSEYTQTIYMGSAAIIVIFALLILILKVKKLFEFVDRCDSMLNMSE